MRYKVIKKLYCPILARRVEKGEEIEVKDEHLESYKGYIEKPKVVEIVEVKKVVEVIEQAKETPKKKVR